MGHLISTKRFGKLSASGSADAKKNKQSVADTKEMLKSDQIFLQNKRLKYYYEFSFVLCDLFLSFYICTLLIWNEISRRGESGREMLQIRRAGMKETLFAAYVIRRNYTATLLKSSFLLALGFLMIRSFVLAFALLLQMNTHTPCQRTAFNMSEHTKSFNVHAREPCYCCDVETLIERHEFQWRINFTPPWASVAKCLMWNSLLRLFSPAQQFNWAVSAKSAIFCHSNLFTRFDGWKGAPGQA